MKACSCLSLAALVLSSIVTAATPRPHIVLVMADDMGWGQTGYYNHPALKTPELDAMATNGLRFDRFYAGAPNCSPTRATVLTGRTNDRTGVIDHGYPLRLQEKTLPRALQAAGYATAHFGKWHLSGFRGPGAPVLAEDDHNPGKFGFDEWLSVTNFFDRDPLMSRRGKIEEFKGDSSEIIVDEALKFIAARAPAQPTFTVIWYGSPHDPFVADQRDRSAFAALDEKSQHHHGELVAMDRSIGTLRRGLRKLGLANDTFVMFNSDNGGLPNITPETVGGLRGFKNSVYEGGLRVPAIIEWPAMIRRARVTQFPACTMDIAPTIAELSELPRNALLTPGDGISLVRLLSEDLASRPQPIGFRHLGRAALVDNQYKIVTQKLPDGPFEVYDLAADPRETRDISREQPALTARLRDALLEWSGSVDASAAGKDYPEGSVSPLERPARWWQEDPIYKPYIEAWKNRPELVSPRGRR